MIRVSAKAGSASRGHLTVGPMVFPVALGRSGIRTNKREGDGSTPRGTYRLLEVRYRPDRIARPVTRLPVRAIARDDGWCDAPGDRNYNRDVKLPYPASCETLWRDDHLYDLLIVLDHNQIPRTAFRGSAIFVHLARGDFAPTEGCVALRNGDMKKLLAHISRDAWIEII